MARKPTCECGECSKCKQREVARRYRERHPERAREASKRWLAANYDKRKEAEQERYNPRKNAIKRERAQQRRDEFDWEAQALYQAKQKAARWAVKWAIQKGALTKEPCFCGEAVVHAHHEDYDKPLEVVWLCPTHHGERHQELNRTKPFVPRSPRPG